MLLTQRSFSHANTLRSLDDARVDEGDPPIFAAGDVLADSYEIRGMLGQGGMAQVFEAHDRVLNRLVAVKTDRRLEGGPGPSRLRREAQALAAVRHPSLVSVHGMGMHGAREFLVMERIFGVTLDSLLDERLKSGRPFSPSEVLDYLIGICDGLAAVDRAGGAHRDVKPGNVMLSPPDRIILMDFGVFQAEALDRPTQIAGTPEYMAPEAIQNIVARGAWYLVDLYALGIVGYELLAGRLPFAGDVVEILRRQLDEPAPDVSAVRPDVPRRLVRLLGRLMAPSPDDRPDGPEAVLGELRTIRNEVHAARDRTWFVVILEDDEDVLTLLEQSVRVSIPGAQVVTVRTSDEAIARIKRRQPDLLIVDVHGSRMGGIELCLYLRGAGLAQKCTIISLGKSPDPRDLELLKQLGVKDHLEKGPGLIDGVTRAVRRLARTR